MVVNVHSWENLKASREIKPVVTLQFNNQSINQTSWLFPCSLRQVTDYKEEKIDGAKKIRYRV